MRIFYLFDHLFLYLLEIFINNLITHYYNIFIVCKFLIYLYMTIIVGKVYANWCGYCKQLAPEWSKLKKSLKRVQFVEIEEKQINKKQHFESKYAKYLNSINNKPQLEVNGYPTIFKIHPNRKIEYYNGPRIASAMKKWIFPKNKTKRHRTYRNKTYRRLF